MKRMVRWNRRVRWLTATMMTCYGLSLGNGCMDSEIAKRFREAYVPGLMEGLSTAVSAPGQAEAGLRIAWAALMNGIGAMFDVRTPSSSSN